MPCIVTRLKDKADAAAGQRVGGEVSGRDGVIFTPAGHGQRHVGQGDERPGSLGHVSRQNGACGGDPVVVGDGIGEAKRAARRGGRLFDEADFRRCIGTDGDRHFDG